MKSGQCQRINIIFEVSLLKTLKNLTREMQYQPLLSKVFLKTTRSNNNSSFLKDQGTRWSLFVLCAKVEEAALQIEPSEQAHVSGL